jgi:type VI secretion system VasD/TssJ family lipoprotein
MNIAQPVNRVIRVIRYRGCAWMSVIVIGLLCECSGSHMAIHLQGDRQRLNTCGRRDPQPVVVRLYQLRGDANFLKATNDSFWRDDMKALNGDVIERREYTLRPGDEREIPLVLNEQAAFVAVAADFCKPDADLWRKVFQVGDKKGEISVVLYEGRIVLQGM